MDQLQTCIDRLVSCGIRAYIGLLCAGEQVRSRRLLSDTMQMSSLASGGPSALRTRSTRPDDIAQESSYLRCVAFFTLRSLLASLLVLRATGYWRRVPELQQLQHECGRLNRCLGNDADGNAAVSTAPSGSPPDVQAVTEAVVPRIGARVGR